MACFDYSDQPEGPSPPQKSDDILARGTSGSNPVSSSDESETNRVGFEACSLQLPTRLPLTGARALPPVPAALPGAARRRARGGPAGVLRRDRRPGWPGGLCGAPRATQEEELVRLCQAALRRARGGARLSRPLHPPRRYL